MKTKAKQENDARSIPFSEYAKFSMALAGNDFYLNGNKKFKFELFWQYGFRFTDTDRLLNNQTKFECFSKDLRA